MKVGAPNSKHQMASPTLGLLARLVPSNTTPFYTRQTPDPDRIPRIAHAAAYRDRTYYCIAAFIGIVSIFNWMSWLLQGRLSSPQNQPRKRGAASIKRLPAAVMSAFRALAFRKTIHVGSLYIINVSEFALTAGYITLVFTMSMMNSTNLKGVAYDPKYWANTAGVIASTQLSFMVALGMKNNIISFLTGVSFDKLNDLHRMTARVLCVLMWVHAGGRAKLGLKGSNSPSHPWLQCGLLAASSLTVLSIVSLRPIRERKYELFLLIHFVLAFIILLAAYFHTEGGSELGKYVWPAFIVWGTDRVLRGIRIVIFNFGNFIRKGTELNAHVDIISPRFLRIRLQRPAHLRWSPGQSVYLTLPSVSTFPLEAHPFTISTVHSVPEIDEEILPMDEKESSSSPPSSLVKSQESSFGMKQLVFLVRVRSGFSQRLLQAAGGDESFAAFLDGPYSSPPLLVGFETVILIAGGSGVAFTLPLLLDLVHRSNKKPTNTRRIVFVWAIRDIGHVEWISDALVPLMQRIPTSISLEIRLSITGVIEESQSRDNDSSQEDPEIKIVGKTKSDAQLLRMPLVHVRRGRPDIKSLMQQEISCATGDMSVNVCGSHGLANTVRSSLSSPRFLDVLRGGPSIMLHVESA